MPVLRPGRPLVQWSPCRDISASCWVLSYMAATCWAAKGLQGSSFCSSVGAESSQKPKHSSSLTPCQGNTASALPCHSALYADSHFPNRVSHLTAIYHHSSMWPSTPSLQHQEHMVSCTIDHNLNTSSQQQLPTAITFSKLCVSEQ